VSHEHGVNEVVGRKLRLPHHAPDVFIEPHFSV
jgi:hypothetical protein